MAAKKDVGALILALGKPKAGGPSDSDEREEEMGDVKETAAKDLMRAMRRDDTEMFVEAFQRMVDACGGHEEDEME